MRCVCQLKTYHHCFLYTCRLQGLSGLAEPLAFESSVLLLLKLESLLAARDSSCDVLSPLPCLKMCG